MEIDPLTQLEALDTEALDAMPYGVVRLGADGTVEALNQAEADRLGVQRWRATGRDYFRDVAGASARPLASAVAALAPGAGAVLELSLAGARGGRSGAPVTPVTVDARRTVDGKLVLRIRPRAHGARGAA